MIGRAVNDTFLECATPSVPVEGYVSATVALKYTNTKRRTQVIATDGTTDSSAGLTFQFYNPEVVSAIRPYEGPARGGTALSIFGSDFRDTPELVVRFTFTGNSTAGASDAMVAPVATTVAVNFVSDVELLVNTPKCPMSSTGGFFFVDVSSNGVDFTPSDEGPLYFYDTSEPFVDAIAPVILREGGGAVVTIRGSSFPETYPTTLACVFGDAVPVPATRHSAELITCTAPSRVPGPVAVTVTSYRQSLSAEGDLMVEFIGALRVSSSWPTLGPASGGTVVTVNGEGFHVDEVYLCAFGSLQPPVISKFVNSSAITCVAPSLSRRENEGHVALQVLTSGDSYGYWESIVGELQDTALATGVEEADLLLAPLTFQYHYDIDVFRLNPANGPDSGGTEVRVSGSGFRDLPTASCQFGVGEPAPARVVDEWTLVCTANSFAAAVGNNELAHQESANVSKVGKGVPLRVTANGVDFSPKATPLFYYDAGIIMHSLAPDRGPSTGGMRVVIRGSGFQRNEYLGCRFGLELVVAEFLADDTIVCVAPPQSRLAVVVVSVTMNGQDFTSMTHSVGDDEKKDYLVFTYTNRAVVTEIQPNTGPTRGGTTVKVFGANFPNITTILRCRFGTVETAAEFVSPELVTCVAPAVAVGTGRVYLEVSDAGSLSSKGGAGAGTYCSTGPGVGPMIWTNSHVVFLFTEDAAVLAAFPSSGPCSGGTLVSLTGFGFENLQSLGCRFGDAAIGEEFENEAQRLNEPGAQVSAKYVSPTEVVCVAPPAHFTELDGNKTGRIRVAVTLNGQDYELRMAQFTYYPTPQASALFFESGRNERRKLHRWAIFYGDQY